MPARSLPSVLRIPRGYRSPEAASFMARLDELTARLTEDLHGLSVRELQWQPGPGRNSIGMLLAHIAIVEVWWMGGPACGESEVAYQRVLGIGVSDDGIPAGPDDRHPRALRGKSLAGYLRLLERARGFAKRIARNLTRRDIARPRRRYWIREKRARFYDNYWVMDRVLEHLAWHYGQILLIKELMKRPRPRVRRRRS